MKKNKLIQPPQPNELSEKTKASLKVRVISAIVGLAILIPALFVGDWFFFALIAFIAFSAYYEIVRCVKKNYNIWLYIVTIFLSFLILYWPFFRGIITHNIGPDWRLYQLIEAPYLSLSIIFVGVMLLFLIAILHSSLTVKDACFIFTLVILVSLGMQSALYLRYLPSQQNGFVNPSYFNIYDNLESSTLLIYAIFGTFMTDTGAYFVGILFGKHKLNERISPNKTWEGYFGGLVISFVTSSAFAFILAACHHSILPGIFDLEHWYYIVISSLIMPFLAALGDLIFSSIKRYFSIKDFSNLIPGHGGILDRLDSLIFTITFVALYVCIILAIRDGGLEAFL